MELKDLQKQPKRKLELIFSAILYEVTGSVLASILMKLIGGYQVLDTFFLSIILSCIALFWNMIFNYLFDQYLIKKKGNIIKSPAERILHGLGFELIFAVFGLLFIMVYKQISIVEAFFMEAFFLVFFLIFTMVFTYLYDMSRGLFLLKFHR